MAPCGGGRKCAPLPLEPLLLLAQSLLLYRRALRAIDQAGVETLRGGRSGPNSITSAHHPPTAANTSIRHLPARLPASLLGPVPQTNGLASLPQASRSQTRPGGLDGRGLGSRTLIRASLRSSPLSEAPELGVRTNRAVSNALRWGGVCNCSICAPTKWRTTRELWLAQNRSVMTADPPAGIRIGDRSATGAGPRPLTSASHARPQRGPRGDASTSALSAAERGLAWTPGRPALLSP